jgi:hypothetical protein
MREQEELAWWQHGLLICGNDGEGGDGGANSGGDGGAAGGAGSDGASGDGNGDDGDGDGGDDGDDDLPPDNDVSGLKSALQKEREQRKTAAKELRTLTKQFRDAQKRLNELDDKDKSEVEKATKQAAQAGEKVTKLAGKLRTQAVDALIERHAREMKFIDVDDALTGVDRSKIEVEQDDDDPSDIRVDAKTVKAAVKALADKKKHLIQSEEGEGGGGPSGSRFGGGGNKGGDGKNTAERLKELYPSLR